MAMKHDDRALAERKVSSLPGDTLSPLSRTTGGTGKRKKDKKEKALPSRKGHFPWRSLVVDLLLLVILVSAGLGAWFGYRAAKAAYAPTWEVRDVEFCVEISNIDYDRSENLLPALKGHGLWFTAEVDGQYLGTVSGVDVVPTLTEDGKEVMTLYLTVKTQANYRKGQGYFVGNTRLLAGETEVFRAEGIVAEGTIVSLTDAKEVQA